MVTVSIVREKVEKNNYDITGLNSEELNLFNRMSTLNNHEGKIVRHFKGKFYLILGVVENSETGEEMVAYKAMYNDYKKYVRPIDMFLSKVDKNIYPREEQEYRFDFIQLK